MNHPDPECWGQKTHHRLINEPVLIIFYELGVHWTPESNMWDGTWVPQTALSKILPQQSSEQCCVLSTAAGQLDSWRQSSPVASCLLHLLHPDQLNQPTLDDRGSPLFLLSSRCDSHDGKCKPWGYLCYSCTGHFLLKPGEFLPFRVKDLLTSSHGANTPSALLQSSCYFIPLKRT